MINKPNQTKPNPNHSPPIMMPRKPYPRGQYYGFHVKVPLDLQANSQDLVPFLNATLTRTQDFWSVFVNKIHFVPAGATTAVLLHSDKQRYMTKWREISSTMFADWSRTLGEEAVCAPTEDECKKTTGMFKELMRSRHPSVHSFWRKTNHSVEIKQPSPLAGIVVDALRANPANSAPSGARKDQPDEAMLNPFSFLSNFPYGLGGGLGGLGGQVETTPAMLTRNLPRLPLPVFTSNTCNTMSTYNTSSPPRPKQEARSPPQAPRKRAAEAQLPPRPRENPFRLRPNFHDELKRFLLTTRPWNEPLKFREMAADDDLAAYWHEKRQFENRPPAIAAALIHLIPAIARRSECQGHLLTLELQEPHREALGKIYKLLRKTWFWDGIYTLLQWPNMQLQSYGFNCDKPHHPSLNPIEAHRRILKLEGAVAEMADYLAAAVDAGKKHGLRNIAWRDLADAVIVLSARHPVLSARHSDAADTIIAILPQQYKQPCPLSIQLDWLEANRAASLEHHTPFLTELGWGLGLLGLLYSLRASMDRLDTQEEAESILTSLMAFNDRRSYVFAKDMEPILLYGARLTQYTAAVRDLCERFTGLGQVPLTPAGKFYELDVKGRLIGPDGAVVRNGLEGAPKNPPRILPFPIECASLQPIPDLKAVCADLVATEGRLISDMLAGLGIDPATPAACPAVAMAISGQARINALLASDSHALNKTSVLPPSASLPGAWFEPAVVFSTE
jgi:hypothetical protein